MADHVLLTTPLGRGGEDARTQEGGRGCGQGLWRASTGDPHTRKAQTSPKVPGQKNERLHRVGGTDRGSRFREVGFAEKLGEDLNTAEALFPDPLHQKEGLITPDPARGGSGRECGTSRGNIKPLGSLKQNGNGL